MKGFLYNKEIVSLCSLLKNIHIITKGKKMEKVMNNVWGAV